MITKEGALPSEEAIVRALGEFNITPEKTQVLQIQQYMSILLAWNEKVNLTAIRDPLEILHRHFGESMFGAKLIPSGACRLADVGSGGGFPGVPLKLVRPDIELFLVESNVKKATFLAELVRDLGLSETRVLVSLYEELGEEIAPLDVVCSRAVGEFGPFLEWASSAILGVKQVVLWIGGKDLETVQAIKTWQWEEPVPVPQSLRRYLLVGKKQN
jgi:16S rRNA (guanine527-N7)-methyltransferase